MADPYEISKSLLALVHRSVHFIVVARLCPCGRGNSAISGASRRCAFCYLKTIHFTVVARLSPCGRGNSAISGASRRCAVCELKTTPSPVEVSR